MVKKDVNRKGNEIKIKYNDKKKGNWKQEEIKIINNKQIRKMKL